MRIELYAARHGETVANLENRLCGKDTDSPLTQEGVAQARLLGEGLKGIPFEKVYSSPLQRAVATVKIAFGESRKICVDGRLAEIGLGVMDGLTYEEAAEKYPASGMLFFSKPSSYKAPSGGESIEAVMERVSSFLADLERQEGKTVFVQTHGYVLRVLYACTHGKSMAALDESPHYANCDVTHYTYCSGKWELQ